MRSLMPLMLIPLIACSSSRSGVLEDLDVDPTEIDGDVTEGSVVYELDTSADPELVFAAVGATGPQHGTWSEYNVQVVQATDSLEDLEITFVVQVDSVVTNYTALDNHLRSDDFFDVENHPTATFVSTSVTDIGEGNYTISGDMTLRGTTNELSFPSTIKSDGDGIVASAVIEFSRWEYGLIRASATGPGDDGVEDLVVLDYSVRLAPVD